MKLALWSFLLLSGMVGMFSAIHPPNDNKICQRAGCGHPKNTHEKGNGACTYADYIFVFPGHCEGFLR